MAKSPRPYILFLDSLEEVHIKNDNGYVKSIEITINKRKMTLWPVYFESVKEFKNAYWGATNRLIDITKPELIILINELLDNHMWVPIESKNGMCSLFDFRCASWGENTPDEDDGGDI